MRNAVLICVLVSATDAASGQTRSEFEVATVKQLDGALQPGTSDLSFVGTSGKPFRIEGHRVRVRGTLRTPDRGRVRRQRIPGDGRAKVG